MCRTAQEIQVPKSMRQAESSVDFKSSDMTFRQIFSGDFHGSSNKVQLVIDPVQRPYSWSPEKARQTVEALLAIFR